MGTLIFTVLSFNLCFGFSANLELAKGDRAIVASKKDGFIKVIENKNNVLTMLFEETASFGLMSGTKQKQGDHKTPTGIYFGIKFMNIDELPDETYGPMAVILNYPNPIDIKAGKTGSGIWIHGTDEQTRLGPKTSTRGCIIMQNDKLLKLIKLIKLKKTPIIIADSKDTVRIKTANNTSSTVIQYGPLKFKISTGLEKSTDIVYEELK